MTESATAPFIFISYARADDELVTRLRTDLQAQGINIWIDREGVQPGTPDWEETIRTAIRGAHAVLYIASPNARSSHYVMGELAIAEMYRCSVYPVWVAGTQWLEAAPMRMSKAHYFDARDAHYTIELPKIIKTFRRLLSDPPSLSPKTLILDFEPRNPYKGLLAFTDEDSQDFFGRDGLVQDLLKDLHNSLATEQQGKPGSRLLAIVGPSGSGKSSVVMAGLLPRLQDGALPGSKEWVYLDPFMPGVHPMESLASTLWKKLDNSSMKVIREDLKDESACGLHLFSTTLVKQQGTPRTKIVLVVDQFEELFSPTVSEDERRHFINVLVAAITELNGPAIVILTLRADFYDRPMHYPELYKLIQAHHKPVLPMEIEDLRAVIEKPANLPDVRLTFEGDLVGDLLFEVRGQEGALPLLQFTLDQLFQKREGHLLTLRAYHELGGVKGALAKHAESTYELLLAEQHRILARALFLRLIDPGMTERDTTKRRVPLTELSLPDPTQTEILLETVGAFIKARLLTTNTIETIHAVEVSHEALIREWTRLADWLTEFRNDIRLRKWISEEAAEWIRRGKPKNYRMYEGTDLIEAREWMERNIPNKDEVDFIQASIKREQDVRHRRNFFISVGSILSVFLILIIVFLSIWVLQLNITDQGLQITVQQLEGNLPVTVTNLNDHGLGSLREAIMVAPSGGMITFAKNLKGTITLTSGELSITKNLAIDGPDAPVLSISGANISRVFEVSRGVTMNMSNLTIKNGHAMDFGGGIDNNGKLTLINSTVSHNTAEFGGGISNKGELIVTNSTISNNTANQGGGGISNAGNKLVFTNSTIFGNAAVYGGGITNLEGSKIYITYCTIYENIATLGVGGGIANTLFSDAVMEASILAGNYASKNFSPDIFGGLTSYGYNLIQNAPKGSINELTKQFSITGKSPKLGPLQNNGGMTQTDALLPGSPAIDQIPLDACFLSNILIDQRSVKRPQGRGCDLGAYEYIPPAQSHK